MDIHYSVPGIDKIFYKGYFATSFRPCKIFAGTSQLNLQWEPVW